MGDVPLSKRCTKCKEIKVVSEFHRSAKNGDGLKCRCKVCRAEDGKKAYDPAYFRAYYEMHREEIKTTASRYYEENTEHVCNRVREYYRELYSEQAKRNAQNWNRRNPEKVKAARRKHYENHREEKAAYVRTWRRANREKCRQYEHASRTRKAENGGSHTVEEWLALCAAYDGKCACCGAEEQTLDHIVPVLLGGSNDIENIQPLCRSCNSSKGAKELDYRGSTVDRVL